MQTFSDFVIVSLDGVMNDPGSKPIHRKSFYHLLVNLLRGRVLVVDVITLKLSYRQQGISLL